MIPQCVGWRERERGGERGVSTDPHLGIYACLPARLFFTVNNTNRTREGGREGGSGMHVARIPHTRAHAPCTDVSCLPVSTQWLGGGTAGGRMGLFRAGAALRCAAYDNTTDSVCIACRESDREKEGSHFVPTYPITLWYVCAYLIHPLTWLFVRVSVCLSVCLSVGRRVYTHNTFDCTGV